MKLLFSTALAYNLVVAAYNAMVFKDDEGLEINYIQKLDESTEFQAIDFLGDIDRSSYELASKDAHEIVKNHKRPIDAYIILFDYPIQAANGCIAHNKLRGLDPVQCIRMIVNPAQKTNDFHDSHVKPFTNEQLETLIFNAISEENIPVLEELLRFRLSTKNMTLDFLQNAYCWSVIFKQTYANFFPRSSMKVGGNDTSGSLADFAFTNGFTNDLVHSVSPEMINTFDREYQQVSNSLTDDFYRSDYENFKSHVTHKLPSNFLTLRLCYNSNKIPGKYLRFLLENGALVSSHKGSICSATKNSDQEGLTSLLKSGSSVDWDYEMKCISEGNNIEALKSNNCVLMVIKELQKRLSKENVPAELYYGLN